MLGAPLIAIVLDEVTGDDAGSAGGMIATAQRVGHSLGVAIVGTALFSGLPAAAQHTSKEHLASQYAHTVQLAVMYCLGAALLTFVLIFLLPRRTPDQVPDGTAG
jgi:hypothetical protein